MNTRRINYRSRAPGSCPSTYRYLFSYFEPLYKPWVSKRALLEKVLNLPNNASWNIAICIVVLCSVIWASIDYYNGFILIMSNTLYAMHVLALLVYDINKVKCEEMRFTWKHLLGYLIDLASFTLNVAELVIPDDDTKYIMNLICYHVRLHRPLQYLWDLNDYNLKCSVSGTLAKYVYIFFVFRVFFANLFIWIKQIDETNYPDPSALVERRRAKLFFRALYVIYKIFIPIGTDSHPHDDVARMVYITVVILSCLLVTGISVASLTLILGLYMRPEEIFRSRFRIIMNDMKHNKVPLHLSEKVEVFYRMYWYKQKAVSETRLFPIFPHTLSSDIHSNIYYNAQQKSRIIQDLSNQFLAEIAKYMHTVNFIPGDSIIKRNSMKSSIIFIQYGDVEMVTPEDDETPTMRFMCGSILNPYGGSVELACTRAHVAIRATTFCSVHVLHFVDLWRVIVNYGRMSQQAFIPHMCFIDHLNKVKMHYSLRKHPQNKYKSTILMLKRNLMDLKEAREPNGERYMKDTDVFIQISDCYIMRNRADSSLSDESDAICLRQTFPCILQPFSSFLFTWHCFTAFITLVVAFVIPYYVVYLKDRSIEYHFFVLSVYVVFIFDIIVRISTGSKLEEGVPITLSKTFKEYVSTQWFQWDFFSCVPFFYNTPSFGFPLLSKVPTLFRLLKSLEDICVYQSNILRFLSYCLVMILLCYMVAAIKQAKTCFSNLNCLVKNFTHEPFWSNGSMDDNFVSGNLMFSLYWSISMITFTTHKTAQTAKMIWDHQVLAMIVLEVCTILHILIEATYSATIMVTEAMRDEYTTCIDSVKKFLVKNDIDPVLRHRFIDYLHLCWYTDKAYGITHAKTSIFFDLPQHVNQDIMAMERSKYILCIPFMKFLSNTHLRIVSANACVFHTSPNEILLQTGLITNEIYVIKQGFCEVLDPNTKTVISLIGCKSHFGGIECLLRLPAYYTVRAVTHVQVFSISKKHLIDVMDTPKIKDAIQYAKQLSEYEALQVRHQQFLTYKMPIPPPNRMVFPLPRKYEPDSAFLNPFIRLGFLSALRYVFPRFTIRPDGKYLKRYEWFRAACALMSANLYPIYTFVELQWPWLSFVAWLLDSSAYFDILQRMLIGYFNDKGILVYHPSSTAAHYLKGAFFVDLMGCLPLEGLDLPRKSIYYKDKAYQHPSSLQFFMYNRLIQLYRVPNALEILNEYIDRQDIILLIKAIPLFTAFLTISTSFILEFSFEKWKPIDGGWRLIPIPEHNNWVEVNRNAVNYNITATPFNTVLTAFYWVVYETTTTGFNLFNPSRLDIMTALISSMVIGSLVTTFFTVRIISIRANVNQALASFQQDLKDIVRFMKKENLDKELQREVVLYYEYMWDKTGGTEYRSMLKLCDQITLRTDAILYIYGDTFAKCPILHQCDLSLLRVVGRAVHSMYFRQGMTIIEHDDVIAKMYFIQYGVIEVVNKLKDTHPTVMKLQRGSLFGNLDNLKTVVCANKFVALTNVHLLKINAEAFHKIIQDFPNVKALLKKCRTLHKKYIMGIISTNQNETKLEIPSSKDKDPLLHSSFRKYLFTHLQAHSKLILIYLIIVSLLCVYGDMYNSSFKDNSLMLIISLYILDIGFLIKIAMNYFLPNICDEEFLTLKALYSSRKQYLNTESNYDILSCVPVELICFFFNWSWETWAILRLNRCFRVVTVYCCLKRYHQKLSINLTISTIFSVLIWFTLFIHANTCIWHLIGVYQEKFKPRSSWKYNANGQSVCDRHYICACYFILTTFTQNGVGDILPRQLAEVAYVCVLMIMSTMMYMIYVGEFSNIIQFQYFRHFSFFSKILELKEFLKYNRVSQNLTKIINIYTMKLWQESRGLQVPHLLTTAPNCLRLNIMSAAYMHHLKSHPVFSKCEPAFLRQLVGYFQPFIYTSDMYVVREGEMTNSMYFIHKGRVREIDEYFDKTIQIFKCNQYFGSENGLKRNTLFTCSYKTVIMSQVLSLSLNEWEYLLKHFPKSKDIINKSLKAHHTASTTEHWTEDESRHYSRSLSSRPRSFHTVPSTSTQVYNNLNIKKEAKKQISSATYTLPTSTSFSWPYPSTSGVKLRPTSPSASKLSTAEDVELKEILQATKDTTKPVGESETSLALEIKLSEIKMESPSITTELKDTEIEDSSPRLRRRKSDFSLEEVLGSKSKVKIKKKKQKILPTEKGSQGTSKGRPKGHYKPHKATEIHMSTSSSSKEEKPKLLGRRAKRPQSYIESKIRSYTGSMPRSTEDSATGSGSSLSFLNVSDKEKKNR